MICSGGDPDVSAKAAGHSKETKARYYKKMSFEEAQWVEAPCGMDSEYLVHLTSLVLFLHKSERYGACGSGNIQ